MPHNLNQLQLNFKESVYNGKDSLLPWVLEIGPLSKEERVNIYRNTVHVGLKSLLADVYPAIMALVGVEFFRYVTHQFIHEYPPQKGALLYYGASFSDFLKTFPALKDFPYLSGVAELEWARHLSYDAADDTPINVEGFSKLSEGVIQNIKFEWVASVHIFEFDVPIFTLWRSGCGHKVDMKDIDLHQGECVMVYRDKDLNVQVKILSSLEYAFYNALKQGVSFVEASTLCAQDKEFNLQECLVFALGEGLFKNKV